jgi:hypothetical protein
MSRKLTVVVISSCSFTLVKESEAGGAMFSEQSSLRRGLRIQAEVAVLLPLFDPNRRCLTLVNRHRMAGIAAQICAIADSAHVHKLTGTVV